MLLPHRHYNHASSNLLIHCNKQSSPRTDACEASDLVLNPSSRHSDKEYPNDDQCEHSQCTHTSFQNRRLATIWCGAYQPFVCTFGYGRYRKFQWVKYTDYCAISLLDGTVGISAQQCRFRSLVYRYSFPIQHVNRPGSGSTLLANFPYHLYLNFKHIYQGLHCLIIMYMLLGSTLFNPFTAGSISTHA
jgi:hypothetical protein